MRLMIIIIIFLDYKKTQNNIEFLYYNSLIIFNCIIVKGWDEIWTHVCKKAYQLSKLAP